LLRLQPRGVGGNPAAGRGLNAALHFDQGELHVDGGAKLG
jgi:hypothetical protein